MGAGFAVWSSDQGCRTYGARVQNGSRRIPWLATFTTVLIFVIPFTRPASLCCAEKHLYIYSYLTPYRLYINYRCYQITLQ